MAGGRIVVQMVGSRIDGTLGLVVFLAGLVTLAVVAIVNRHLAGASVLAVGRPPERRGGR